MFEFADIETLDSRIKIEEKVLFFFETSWDDNCEAFLDKLIKSADMFEGIPIYRVELDLDGGDYVRDKFEVHIAPTLILFVDGVEDKRITNEIFLEELL